MRIFRSKLEVVEKNEAHDRFDPVTEADRSAEMAMRALINRNYPDHGIVGEEFGGENTGAEYVWILDPIDGTSWSFRVTGVTTTTTTTSTSTTLAPPVIVDMDSDVTLYAILTPTGSVLPLYSTNLGLVPIEWLSISAYTNTIVDLTNIIIEFEPPETNVPAVFYHLRQTSY